MNFLSLLFSLFFFSLPLLGMESSIETRSNSLSEFEQQLQRALEKNDRATIFKFFFQTPDSLPSAFLVCGRALIPNTSSVLGTKIIKFFKKVIEDEDIPFLEEVLFRRPLGVGFIVLAFKETQKLELFTQLLTYSPFSEEHFQVFLEHAFIFHYLDLLKILIKTKEPHYFKDHSKELLEKALKHKWLSLAAYILHHCERTPIIQQVLDESLEESAKAYDEQKVYFLLQMGATRMSTRTFIELWSSLSQYGQPPAAYAILDLIKLFNHSGINEYRDDPEEFHKKYSPENTALIIPYNDWSAGYFSSLTLKILTTLLHLVSQHKPLVNFDTTYATPINRRNDANQTELMWAALLDRGEDVTTLLTKGAHVNARDGYKKTALFYAARYASPHIVRTLLAHGALTFLKDKDGKTPIEHASEANNIANALLILLALKEKDNKYCIAKQIQPNPDDFLSNEILLNSLWDPVQKAGNTSLNTQQYDTLN